MPDSEHGFATLPDGTQIRPGYVQMVEATDSYVTDGQSPRVIIHIAGGQDRRVINCETLEEAEKMRDDIHDSLKAVTDAGGS